VRWKHTDEALKFNVSFATTFHCAILAVGEDQLFVVHPNIVLVIKNLTLPANLCAQELCHIYDIPPNEVSSSKRD
jgi:hypothetical protein